MKYNLQYTDKKDRKELLEVINSSLVSDKTITCNCYSRAYVTPSTNLAGGVYDEKGNYVETSAFQENYSNRHPEMSNDEIVESDDIAIYIGMFHSLWGHTLTDNLKKLWFVYSEEGKELVAKGAKLIYIWLEDKDSFTVNFLHFAGIKTDNLMEIRQTTRFKYIYIPDNSILYDQPNDRRTYTKEFEWTISQILKNIEISMGNTLPVYEKIYFSRRKLFQDGREWGESSIEKMFKMKGYEIISPEKLSFKEQIWLLRNCTSFASTEGSISHSVIFCKPNTDVILIRKCNRINTHQLILNDVSKVDVTYIDANHSFVLDERNPLNGPFYLCVTKELEAFAEQHIYHIPYWLNPVYWWYSLHRIKWIEMKLMHRHIIHKFERLLWKLGA